ncbi:hypothetical protein MKX03_014787 [Papaver bracteatum]|nr:hypothetical protein MKX03_014787 [Papaver bracteatum]
MATKKNYLGNQIIYNRFVGNNLMINSDTMFEFDGSSLWNSNHQLNSRNQYLSNILRGDHRIIRNVDYVLMMKTIMMIKTMILKMIIKILAETSSLSIHEGIGQTLKGRDLSILTSMIITTTTNFLLD